jgi:hypothetical protein
MQKKQPTKPRATASRSDKELIGVLADVLGILSEVLPLLDRIDREDRKSINDRIASGMETIKRLAGGAE